LSQYHQHPLSSCGGKSHFRFLMCLPPFSNSAVHDRRYYSGDENRRNTSGSDTQCIPLEPSPAARSALCLFRHHFFLDRLRHHCLDFVAKRFFLFETCGCLFDHHHQLCIKELKAAGADEVIFEYEHGDTRTKKELNMLLQLAKEGDTIITLEVSRLSRSTQQLCELIDIIWEKRLRLVIMGSITIDCREGKVDPMSEAFLQMAGVFSQLELAMIRARVKSGMENAKAKGKKIGRRPTTKEDIPANFLKHYAIFMEGKMNVSELARVCGLSRPTVYKYLKMIG